VQSAFDWQRPHAPVDAQNGLACGQAALAPEPKSPLQAVHVPAVALQIGVVPMQREAFVAEHWPQAPEASHAGALALGQARDAPEPKSPLHAAQTSAAVLHTGVVPVQCDGFVAVHCAHVPEEMLQAGVAPVHCV
jgi:hypothetical protein